ncbi:MAG: hypothetical protein U0670_01135 [Anaerolineae bacterium]
MHASWLELFYASFPGLKADTQSPLVANADVLWSALARLLNANAPRTGCALPGGIGEVIAQIAAEQGIADRFTIDFANTGCAAITLGVHKPQPDILIVAHMDRPSFRVRSAASGEIYPVCAVRIPKGGYRCAAKAVRYDPAARGLVVTSHGEFIGGEGSLHYQTSGSLSAIDTIVMDAEPTLTDGVIVGTGLDNCLGVIAALGAALILKAGESALIAANQRVMIAFSDEEEGNPEVFFGHGAARLAHAARPEIGAIICDAHTAGNGLVPQLGGGASHGVVTGQGKGSLVGLNYVALADSMIRDLERKQPGTAQFNDGYLSRSDDMGMSRVTRVLGLIGAPMRDPHTAQESAHLRDLPPTMVWLAMYTAACLGLSPELTRDFALVGQ